MLSTTTLNPYFINQEFTETISVTYTDPESANNEVLSVSPLVPVNSININFTNTDITISGYYDASIFDQNIIKTITRGKSDKLEAPTEVRSFNSINTTKQVISFKPDPRNSITFSYEVITSDGQDIVTQEVLNDYSRAIPSLKGLV